MSICKARSDDAIGRGRPPSHEPKSKSWDAAQDSAWAPADSARMNRRTALAALCLLAFLPAGGGVAQTRPDLVSRDRLRVCAAPADLPFSNKAKEGFKNKIAELVAEELQLPLHYFWMPSGPGFVRNTLMSDMCDLVIGYAAEADLVDHSNPYYASTYVLVTRKGGPLDGVDHLEDPRLRNAKLGVIAATPPVDHLMALGLFEHARPYSLLVDRRFSSPAEDALHDLEAGVIDAAILWGPIGGYFAKQASPPLSATPLKTDTRPLSSSARFRPAPRRDRLEAQAERHHSQAAKGHRRDPYQLWGAARARSRADRRRRTGWGQ